jgi:NMD protein affecting ribosome stability and mRNA decay
MAKATLATNPKYFEAIIQLRPYDERVFQFILDDIKRMKNENIFISKVEELKTGVDIYISSQKFARSLGDKMKRAFKGWKLLITKKFQTSSRLKSKDLYRGTILFRKNEEKRVSEDQE